MPRWRVGDSHSIVTARLQLDEADPSFWKSATQVSIFLFRLHAAWPAHKSFVDGFDSERQGRWI